MASSGAATTERRRVRPLYILPHPLPLLPPPSSTFPHPSRPRSFPGSVPTPLARQSSEPHSLTPSLPSSLCSLFSALHPLSPLTLLLTCSSPRPVLHLLRPEVRRPPQPETLLAGRLRRRAQGQLRGPEQGPWHAGGVVEQFHQGGRWWWEVGSPSGGRCRGVEAVVGASLKCTRVRS